MRARAASAWARSGSREARQPPTERRHTKATRQPSSARWPLETGGVTRQSAIGRCNGRLGPRGLTMGEQPHAQGRGCDHRLAVIIRIVDGDGGEGVMLARLVGGGTNFGRARANQRDARFYPRKAAQTHGHDEQRRKQSQKPEHASHCPQVVPRSDGLVKRGARLREAQTRIGTPEGAGRWLPVLAPGSQPPPRSDGGPGRSAR
jgi:hypothetical protein